MNIFRLGRFMMFLAIYTASVFAVLHYCTVPASAQFDPLEASCDTAQNGRPELCGDITSGSDNPVSGQDGILTTAANIIAIAAAVIAVIVIIVAGLTMVLSSGDSSRIRSSRDAIIYAAIGLTIIAMARAIIAFVVGRF